MTTEIKGREGVREFLKAQGKDPEKFIPKNPVQPNPESLNAGSDSSSGNKKITDDKEKETVSLTDEQKEQERVAQENAQKVEKEDQDRILSVEESELTDEDKKKKKEILLLRATEKEAQREASIQKRFDELTGQIKDLKSEKTQDKEAIKSLESELQNLRGSIDRNPDKIKAEVKRLESERVSRYAQEDAELPRDERREMTDEELEEWMVEDLVSAQTWLADRQLRRNQERQADIEKMKSSTKSLKAEEVIKLQKESQARVQARHPDLDPTKRIEELKTQGKSKEEIQRIVLSENKKLKLVTEILRENSDRYLLSPNGPELLVEEMERRMSSGKGETQEEKETRIAEEAAEAERQRQSSVDSGISANGRRTGMDTVSASEFEKENPKLYKQQLDIWRRNFPKSTEKELRARLDKRLKERRALGAS